MNRLLNRVVMAFASLAFACAASAQSWPAKPIKVIVPGMPGFETGSWQGIVAPAGTPPEIVRKLHATVTAVLSTEEMKQRLDKAGAELRPQSSEQFGAFIREEKSRWAKVVKESGAKFE